MPRLRCAGHRPRPLFRYDCSPPPPPLAATPPCAAPSAASCWRPLLTVYSAVSGGASNEVFADPVRTGRHPGRTRPSFRRGVSPAACLAAQFPACACCLNASPGVAADPSARRTALAAYRFVPDLSEPRDRAGQARAPGWPTCPPSLLTCLPVLACPLFRALTRSSRLGLRATCVRSSAWEGPAASVRSTLGLR